MPKINKFCPSCHRIRSVEHFKQEYYLCDDCLKESIDEDDELETVSILDSDGRWNGKSY